MNSKIEHLVLSGGGAKGPALVGAIRALEDLDHLKNISTISGASAGALTAGLVATGIKGEELQKVLQDLDFKAQLGSKSQKSQGMFKGITKTGEPLLEFMRGQIKKNILNRLESLDRKLSEEYQNKDIITFKDLNDLAVKFPNFFKKLYVNAIEYPSGDMKVFNQNSDDADIEVAAACCASAAIPVLLQPVRIKDKLYLDGGYVNNTPTPAETIFSTSSPLEQKNIREKTLILAFGVSNNLKKNYLYQSLYGKSIDENFPKNEYALYKPSIFERVKRDILPNILIGLEATSSNTENKDAGFRTIHKHYSHRTVELTVGPIDTTDFDLAKLNYDLMVAIGYFNAINYDSNYLSETEHEKITLLRNHLDHFEKKDLHIADALRYAIKEPGSLEARIVKAAYQGKKVEEIIVPAPSLSFIRQYLTKIITVLQDFLHKICNLNTNRNLPK